MAATASLSEARGRVDMGALLSPYPTDPGLSASGLGVQMWLSGKERVHAFHAYSSLVPSSSGARLLLTRLVICTRTNASPVPCRGSQLVLRAIAVATSAGAAAV